MIPQVRPAEFDAWLQRHPDNRPLLLDVREPGELQLASVAADARFEFVHIPMQQVPARLHELPADRPVACLCHHGMRSMQVAAFLAARGFDDVANVAGGIDAWSRERDTGVPRY
ncbi:rhodanese-like domain-containing protein [Ramlibacter sp. AN1015]|uniref:rhodanese-like domain-containing protein n=1 Tax=Ramlibacter sp. AN1015 TaxID=3133428 RepID=UPI0030BE9298